MPESQLPALTHERLMNLLVYNLETGEFRWRVTRKGPANANRSAGSMGSDGYRKITVDYRGYRTNRLAWLYVHGQWPDGPIDHINRVKTDDRIANLRVVTLSQNQHNQLAPRGNNTSGFLGVSRKSGSRKWNASIAANGSRMFLGSFDSPEKAASAYMTAKRQLHSVAFTSEGMR
jgi:hypothetical protein